MSLVKRVCVFYNNTKDFVKGKNFSRYLVFTLAYFVCIGVFLNTYTIAQHSEYDHLEMYEEIREFTDTSTGVPGANRYEDEAYQIGDATAVFQDLVYPQGNVNHAQIVANPKISPGAKLGLIGSIDIPLTALLYNPPSIDVAEHLAQEWIPNYKNTDTAVYASGYTKLQNSGISDLWQTTRNIAYMLFVIVFIVAGFMVMFRHKLGGQTMVTIYNTLPGVIIGLVLVTFSFAIVGLLLDLGAVLTRVIAGFLDISPSIGGDSVDPTKMLGVWRSYNHEIKEMMNADGGLVVAFTNEIMSFLGSILNKIFSAVLGGIVRIVVSIIIAYVSIKIFITLVKTYVAILFDTIMAPIIFAIATIPGKSGLMKDWLNRILKNVTVFVMVFLLVNLPIYFMQNNYIFNIFGGNLANDAVGQDLWGVGKIVMAAVAVYLLFLAASAPKLLEEYFPQTKGQHTSAGVDDAKKQMAKMPGFGGLKG